MLIKRTVSEDGTNEANDKDVGDKEKKKRLDKAKKKYHKHKHKDKMKTKLKEKSKDKEKKKHHSKKQQDEKPSAKNNDFMDLNQQMWPIAHYITDRKKMLEEMFAAIGWKHLKAMLPPHLKNAAIENIQELCLGELLGMSNRRILSILAGQQMENSSESDGEDSKIIVKSKAINIDGSAEIVAETVAVNSLESKMIRSSTKSVEKVKKRESKLAPSTRKVGDKSSKKLENCKPRLDKAESKPYLKLPVGGESDNPSDLDTLEIGITYNELGDLLEDDPTKKRSLTKSVSNAEDPVPVKRLKSTKTSIAVESMPSTPASICSIVSEDDAELDTAAEDKKGKTLLEILELEMRARVIRALLKQQVDDPDNTSGSQSPDVLSDQLGLYMDKLNSEEDEFGCLANSAEVDEVSTDSKSYKSVKVPIVKHPERLSTSHVKNGIINVSPNCTPNLSERTSTVSTSTKNNLGVQDINTEPCSPPNALSSSVNTSNNIEYKCGIEQRSIRKGRIRIDRQTLKLASDDLEGDISSAPLPECDGVDLAHKTPAKQVSKDLSDSNSSSKLSSRNETLEGLSDLVNPAKFLTEVAEESRSSVCSTDFVTKKVTLKHNSDTCRPTNEESANLEESPVHMKEQFDSFNSTDRRPSKLILNDSVSCTEVIELEDGFDEHCVAEASESKQKQMENSWASRWLQSKDVQKVVSTSKMCAKIRKRMKSAQKLKQMQNKDILSTCITGSVEEYRTLDKSNLNVDNV